MKTVLSFSIAVLIGMGFVGGATGQYTPPVSRPTVSPYLNLLNRSNSPALNYYGIVRPQVEFRSSIGQLQRQGALAQEEARDSASGLVTGHPTYFFNYGSYFGGAPGGGPNQGLGGAGRPFASSAVSATRGGRR